ncbi:MAG: hypothetical protein NTY03_01270 [Candidatus Bathyarchaeota archaeon]|nr:hypothetical protein [Candidatus Bathyarchaeota archaeon]
MEGTRNYRIRLRLIGREGDIERLLTQLESAYKVRLYPSPPEEDRQYGPGNVRIYVEIPEARK